MRPPVEQNQASSMTLYNFSPRFPHAPLLFCGCLSGSGKKRTFHKMEAEMKRIVLSLLTALAVTALVLALSPVSAGAQSDAFPTGTYTTTITYEDVAKYGLPPIYHEILEGEWELTFNADGSFEVRNTATEASAQGAYFANQTVFIYGKDSGQLACYSPAKAVYKWSVSGDTLTLTAVSEHSERCWGRYIVSTSHPLVKIEP
jgi:hypothetical protein